MSERDNISPPPAHKMVGSEFVTIPAAEYMALREALKPFAEYAGDPSYIKQRAFLQLLICPLGDEHPDNHVPLFQAARAALSLNTAGDDPRG